MISSLLIPFVNSLIFIFCHDLIIWYIFGTNWYTSTHIKHSEYMFIYMYYNKVQHICSSSYLQLCQTGILHKSNNAFFFLWETFVNTTFRLVSIFVTFRPMSNFWLLARSPKTLPSTPLFVFTIPNPCKWLCIKQKKFIFSTAHS